MMRKMGLEKTLVLGIFVGFAAVGVSGYHDYRDALSKSLIFFEGQRSGKLPPGQNLKWRTDSGLTVIERIDDWEKRDEVAVQRAVGTVQEITGDERPDLARLSVGLRVVRTLLSAG